MIPYYKLPQHWAKDSQYFMIIGPEGLVSADLFETIKKQYNKHTPRFLSIFDKDDIEQFKVTISNSLIPNPELLFVRIHGKALPKFPLTLHSVDKIIVLYSIKKAPTKKHNAYTIRTYALKEPYKSKAIQKILTSNQLNISKKALQWLSLSHQQSEDLLINTIQKIKMTYNKNTISDEEIKPLIYNYNDCASFEVIEKLIDSKTSLQIFLSSQRPEDFQAIFWTVVKFWRHLVICHSSPSSIQQYFLCSPQEKQALYLLKRLSMSRLQKQLQALVLLETDIKGVTFEPFAAKLQHWLIQTQLSL